MSKLSQLQGKPQKFTIGEVEFELKPLTVNELELFSVDEKASLEEQMKSSKKLIQAVLRKSVPDATPEEINNISVEYLTDFMEAIMSMHKFSGGTQSKIEAAKELIRQRRENAEQASKA